MFDNNTTIRGNKKPANTSEETKRNNHIAAKASAAAILGAALGVAGSQAMGAQHADSPAAADSAAEKPEANRPQAAHHEEPQAQTAAKEPQHEQPQHEEAHHTQAAQPKATPAANEEQEGVVIHKVESRIDEDGNHVQIASATINGHEAVLIADENGHIETLVVDGNDNGLVEQGEVADLSQAHLYLNGNEVVDGQPTVEVSTPHNDEPEVKVIAVEHNVDLDGQTVDVAAVQMGDENVMLIDSDQNGEANVAIADLNHNGQIDQGEMADVSEHHIMMPTDAPTGTPGTVETGDDLPDYSDNADITMVEV